jgi:hypothetical protein
MLTGAHKTQRMASALTFLERHHKDGNKFLNHILTGDEASVLFMNVETVKSVDAHTFTKEAEKV